MQRGGVEEREVQRLCPTLAVWRDLEPHSLRLSNSRRVTAQCVAVYVRRGDSVEAEPTLELAAAEIGGLQRQRRATGE